MIPKTIHYCWFGHNPKPDLAEKCIASWKKYCPDYEIIEWNESNFDVSSAPIYVRQAYEAGKWAYVTDYVRLKVIYENGGIYLDTDVELLMPLDNLLSYCAFFGFENTGRVATGLGFGAEKGLPLLADMLNEYLDLLFIKEDGSFDLEACPVKNTRALEKYGLIKNGATQILENNIAVFSSEYFCPLNFETRKLHKTASTYSIHWYNASWWGTKEKVLYKVRLLINRSTSFLGENNYEKMVLFWKKIRGQKSKV